MLVVDILGIRDSEEKDCYTTGYLPWVSDQKRWYRVSPRDTTKSGSQNKGNMRATIRLPYNHNQSAWQGILQVMNSRITQVSFLCPYILLLFWTLDIQQ